METVSAYSPRTGPQRSRRLAPRMKRKRFIARIIDIVDEEGHAVGLGAAASN